ncbi:MAG: DUF418 domain-containing protein [Betaproteobacteria bacterium]
MQRDAVIDALRGFALFGILAVNIQCFVTGLAAPSLGILTAQSSSADHLAVVFTAFLLEFKFYPIFGFCFGYGFAVQMRRWTAQGVDAPQRFTRRMNAMLLMGLVHGGLLWFGDILTRYAAAGYLLKRYAGAGPHRLIEGIRFWALIALVLMVVGMLGMATSSPETPSPGKNASSAEAVTEAEAEAEVEAKAEVEAQTPIQLQIVKAITAYTESGYAAATAQRLGDYFYVSTGFVFLIPQFMVLFLLGAIAAQLGLLRRPERHRALWKKMLAIGLIVGVPLNAFYACLQWQASQTPFTAAPHPVLGMITGELAPVLSIAFVAVFALMGNNSLLVRLFAPAGRIALSLYVTESLLMALFLNGFGLGIGGTAGPGQLLLLATAIYAVLLAGSRLMLRFDIGGPLENWWRRYTYAQNH